MKVYLLRHGTAENGGAGRPDSERALTREGKDELRKTLQLAKRAKIEPSLVITSPYRRAVETAEIAVDELGYRGETVRSEQLEPASSPEAVWEEIRQHRDEEEIMLVGHEPVFSAATAFLLGSPEMHVDFKKGAMVRVDIESFGSVPRGLLKWMITAKLAE